MSNVAMWTANLGTVRGPFHVYLYNEDDCRYHRSYTNYADAIASAGDLFDLGAWDRATVEVETGGCDDPRYSVVYRA